MRFAVFALTLLSALLPCVVNFLIMQNDSETVTVPNAAGIRALCSLLHTFYVPETLDFMISINSKDAERLAVEDFLSELLPHLYMVKVQIENVNGSRQFYLHRKYNLIIVDGFETLVEFDPATLTKDYDVTEIYIVYLMHQNSPSAEALRVVQNIFKYFWRNYILNVSLLLESSPDAVELYTYFPFTNADNCKKPVVRSINRFTGRWLKPNRSDVFPLKLGNLHSCPLRVAVWDAPPYLSFFPHKIGFKKVGDFEGQMLVELSKKLNFSLDFVVPPNDEQRGKVLENGSTTGAIKLLQEGQADLSLGSFRYTLERSEVLTGALPYYQTWQIFGVLLTSQPYSSLEILTFAFDNKTWLCLGLSVQITLAAAYFVKWRRYKQSYLAKIILGTPKPSTPLTNMIGIFLGIPITKEPTTNFTRFIVILWFVYGYLMRSAYQSLLFQLLQTNLYREPPKTFTDLIEMGYILLMTQNTYDSIKTVPRLEQNFIRTIINNETSELSAYAGLEVSSEKRLVGVSPMDFLTYYVISKDKRGMFYILPEKIFTQHITMYFAKHSYLINRFNKLLMDLRSLGLIDYWASKSLDMSYFKAGSMVEVAPISYEHIVGVFIIYDVLMGVALGVFCLEIIWDKLWLRWPNGIRRIRGLDKINSVFK